MKRILLWTLVSVSVFMHCCISSKRTVTKTLNAAIIGQNELVVFDRLGVPAKTTIYNNGNKVWIYQSGGLQFFSGPNTSWHSSTHSEQLGVRKARTFKSTFSDLTIRTPDKTASYTLNDDKAYTLNNPFLKVYFNRQGKCIHFEQNMTQEQQEVYHNRLKQYLAEK